ncbi:peptidase M23 [Streptomyces lavendofoliae]|uniref:SH3 domain-containing protein n=1 Tax=Streptomyces lavendofoliae TaxID=67314 RepID=A0A918M5C5_9ACTN|nr:peptidase M23 [Streptomyces lavendofoliae]GGU48062.1 hypothetical protein GCM10010274_40870 [Streptomyces lavendofoliae]
MTAAAATTLALALASPAAVAAPAAVPSATGTAPNATMSAAATSVYIWATGVNVRYDGADADCVHYPSRGSCVKIVATVSRTTAEGICQHPGEVIADGGYRNGWWTLVKLSDGTIGWVNNIYIQGGEKIAGVPDCGW